MDVDEEQQIPLVNEEGEIIGNTQVDHEVSENANEHPMGDVTKNMNEQHVDDMNEEQESSDGDDVGNTKEEKDRGSEDEDDNLNNVDEDLSSLRTYPKRNFTRLLTPLIMLVAKK